MNSRINTLLTALTAFGAGYVAGILFAPESGKDTRRRVSQTTQASTRWVGERLQQMETQLSRLEQDLQTLRYQVGASIGQTAHEAVEHFIPTLPEEEMDLDFDDEDVSRNLRHLPRK